MFKTNQVLWHTEMDYSIHATLILDVNKGRCLTIEGLAWPSCLALKVRRRDAEPLGNAVAEIRLVVASSLLACVRFLRNLVGIPWALRDFLPP